VRLVRKATQNWRVSWDWFAKRHKFHTLHEIGSQNDANFTHLVRLILKATQTSHTSCALVLTGTQTSHISCAWFSKRRLWLLVIIGDVRSCRLVAKYRRFRGGGYTDLAVYASFICEVDFIFLRHLFDWQWMTMVQRQNDTDITEPRYSVRTLLAYHFMRQKSHMHCPGIEFGPPKWEAGD
jgi:hypothetical protein